MVVLAAGTGQRVGGLTNKVLLPLGGRPVLTWSLHAVAALAEVIRVVLVVRDDDRRVVTEALARHLPDLAVDLVNGGDSRHASERRALQLLRGDVDAGTVEIVVIHDAARPLATGRLFSDVASAAQRYGAALPVLDQPGLVPRRAVVPVPDRVVAVQTPQAFRAGPLLAAYDAAERDGFVGTDTASCVERYTDLEVACVDGDARNLKITFAEDVEVAERLLVATGAEVTPRPPAHQAGRGGRPDTPAP